MEHNDFFSSLFKSSAMDEKSIIAFKQLAEMNKCMYDSYIEAGFTKQEALSLVIASITTIFNNLKKG